jgi:hypothetical protein
MNLEEFDFESDSNHQTEVAVAKQTAEEQYEQLVKNTVVSYFQVTKKTISGLSNEVIDTILNKPGGKISPRVRALYKARLLKAEVHAYDHNGKFAYIVKDK